MSTTAPTVNPVWRAIGARIQERRVGMDMSEDTLATLSRTTMQAVKDFEDGTRQPNGLQFYRIAQALGCKVADLLPGGEQS